MIELYYAVRHRLSCNGVTSSLLILFGALVFVFGLSVCCQKSERRMTASVLTLYVFGCCCYLCCRWVLSRVVLVNCCYSVLSLSVCQSVSLSLSSFNCFALNKQKVFLKKKKKERERDEKMNRKTLTLSAKHAHAYFTRQDMHTFSVTRRYYTKTNIVTDDDMNLKNLHSFQQVEKDILLENGGFYFIF